MTKSSRRQSLASFVRGVSISEFARLCALGQQRP